MLKNSFNSLPPTPSERGGLLNRFLNIFVFVVSFSFYTILDINVENFVTATHSPPFEGLG